jgi:thioredoxin 1
MIREVNDSNWQENVRHGKSILKFTATWCGPCRMQEPILKQVDEETDINVFELDIDKNPVTPEKFGVKSIPTMIVFENGKEIKRFVGVQSKNTLVNY